MVNNTPLGRNTDEVIRLVDAVRHVEEQGEVCPAGWEEGKEGLRPSHEGIAEYLAKNC